MYTQPHCGLYSVSRSSGTLGAIRKRGEGDPRQSQREREREGGGGGGGGGGGDEKSSAEVASTTLLTAR